MFWLGLLGWYAKSCGIGFAGMLNDTQLFYPLGVNLLPYAFLITLPLFSAARSVAGFGIVPLVCVSLLSSMGLDDWLRRVAGARMSVRRRQMLAFFLVGLTVLEFYPGTYPLTDPQQFSGSAYVWLSHQAGSYAILEYPVTHVDVLSGYHVLVSGKETVSGFVNIPSKALSDYLISVSFFQPDQTGAFSRPIDVPRLAELNIRFILFHKAAYAAAFGEQALVKALAVANMTEGLSYIGDFEGTAVYQVTAIGRTALSGTYCVERAGDEECGNKEYRGF